MGRFDYRSCCVYSSWTVVAVIFFVLCVTLLAGGTELYRHRDGNTVGLDVVPAMCRLESSRVVERDGTWIVTYNEGRVVESPFAARYTRELALLSAYPLNATYPCMCPPVPGGGAWRACFLNVNLTRHLQMTGLAYTYGGDILVTIGSIILVTVVFATTLMIATRGCCCEKKQAIYVLDDEEDKTPI